MRNGRDLYSTSTSFPRINRSSDGRSSGFARSFSLGCMTMPDPEISRSSSVSARVQSKNARHSSVIGAPVAAVWVLTSWNTPLLVGRAGRGEGARNACLVGGQDVDCKQATFAHNGRQPTIAAERNQDLHRFERERRKGRHGRAMEDLAKPRRDDGHTGGEMPPSALELRIGDGRPLGRKVQSG